VTGDAYSPESVANAVRDHDAVVSAFNPGWNDPELFDNFLRGSEAIVRGVEASGVRRLVVIGGAGSLFVAPGVQLVDTDSFIAHVPPNIVPGARAARDALNSMRSNTTLDWTFVSPPAFLEEGERTGTYRLGEEQLLMDGDKPAGISVADLAVAVVDELETPRHIKARFTAARKAAG
jgi:putative NADH-flavin reductase